MAVSQRIDVLPIIHQLPHEAGTLQWGTIVNVTEQFQLHSACNVIGHPSHGHIRVWTPLSDIVLFRVASTPLSAG